MGGRLANQDLPTRLRPFILAHLVLVPPFVWVGAWSLLFLPPLYLIYYSYRLYLERLRQYAEQVQQDTARIQQLSTLNHALVNSLNRTTEGDASAALRGLQRVQGYALTLAKA